METGDIAGRKKGIRVKMLASRAAQSAFWRALRSRKICARISRLSAFRRAKVVALFNPFRGEVNVLPVVRLALRAGKVVAFPRVEGKGKISFYRINSLSGLVKSRYGIMEPARDATRRIDNPDLFIVPGAAFSGTGGRLGYGGGFYDRILKKRSAVAVGVAFGFQITAVLPEGPHDAGMDAVATEARVFFCAPHKG